MHVRPSRPADTEALLPLIAGFRVALAALKDREREPDLEAAREELASYEQAGHPIFVAEHDGRLVGYIVCRVADDVVWAESLYVAPAYRRRGIASALYARAEALAEELSGETLYNWVHPNNDAIIAFLKGRGYTVLNLVEIRRPRSGEEPSGTVCVGDHVFDY
ncbi:MAG: GNAT family N-acetyltransferase [Anaerolineae bacterium]